MNKTPHGTVPAADAPLASDVVPQHVVQAGPGLTASDAVQGGLKVVLPQHQHHPREFAANRFVYPVLSRRAGGISVGINLNPDKICNFDCIYCQVNRVETASTRFVDVPVLLRELEETLTLVRTGAIYNTPEFAEVPSAWRRLSDMAFSGDGEPTTYTNFDEIVAECAAVKRRLGLDQVKMVLITNASMFHRPAVQRGLAILDDHQGEVWAKLEAGTEAYYKLVERTSIPFSRILENITAAARVRPLVIQSLFMRIRGEPPPLAELHAFCERLREIVASGGRIKLVQIYTVARPPAESFVSALSTAEIASLVDLVRCSTGLAVQGYGGTAA